MAIRRPRIKPVANIGITKRKAKIENIENPVEIQKTKLLHDECKKESVSIKNEDQIVKIPLKSEVNDIVKQESSPSEGINHIPQMKIPESSPTKICNESILKPRQRIRATPCFDVRRNSITNSICPNSLAQTQNMVISNNSIINHGDNHEKSSTKEILQQKPHVQPGNRTPNSNRTYRVSESSNGGFLSPTSISLNSPNFTPNYNQNSPQHETNSICMPPSREHIPPRYRKISSMEDTQKLSSARKEFQSKYSRKSPEKSALKLCDFIFYNPSSNPMVFETKENNNIDINKDETNQNSDEDKDQEDDGNGNKEQEEERAPVPQLKLGPNGEIILDEQSLVIETTAEKQARSLLTSSKSAIYLDEYSDNNGFYSRQKRTKDWAPEETIKFYRCLHTIGTDFSMMLSLFPNRSRRDLKLKFKKEERNNGSLINKALLQPNAFDIETLKNELEHEERIAEEKRIEESERKLKFQKKVEGKLANYMKNDETCEVTDKNKRKPYCSRAKNILSKGDLAYEIEDLPTNIRKRKRKIKMDMEENINRNLNENKNFIKNEDDGRIAINVNKGEEVEDHSVSEIDENLFINEMDVDDLVSVNSINDFGYGESFGIEITDIGDILSLEDTIPEIDNSTLAIVTKQDKNNPESVTHGIYIICRTTGIMSQKPLDLPEDTVNCILKALGKI